MGYEWKPPPSLANGSGKHPGKWDIDNNRRKIIHRGANSLPLTSYPPALSTSQANGNTFEEQYKFSKKQWSLN
jgi:hypothetical protein